MLACDGAFRHDCYDRNRKTDNSRHRIYSEFNQRTEFNQRAYPLNDCTTDAGKLNVELAAKRRKPCDV